MTLTEYALIFSVLAVGTLAATQYLSDEASEETMQQASCVSERPPPPSCQIPSAATTTSTTVTPGPTTSTTVATPTIAPPLPGNTSNGVITVTSGTQPGPWTATFSGTVLDADGVGVPNAVIHFGVYYTNGTTVEYSGAESSCITDASGTCTTLNFAVPGSSGITGLQVVINEVTGVSPEPNLPGVPMTLTPLP